MKKQYLLLIILAVSMTVGLVGAHFYSAYLSGRNKIYPLNSGSVTKFGGWEQVFADREAQVYVDPKEGRPFVVNANEANDLSAEDFNLTQIPAQKELLYAVGKFLRWEKVPNSNDWYMVVIHKGMKIAKYRLLFDEQADFDNQQSLLSVENVSPRQMGVNEKLTNPLDKVEPVTLKELGISYLKQKIKPGDTVAVNGVQKLPTLSLKDSNGNYAVSWLIVRRNGGLNTWENEKLLLGGWL